MIVATHIGAPFASVRDVVKGYGCNNEYAVRPLTAIAVDTADRDVRK